MRKIAMIVVLLLAALVQSNKTFASHAAAGEIIYEWLSDSTYRFYITHYRDCSGIKEYDTARICFDNPCNPSTNFTVLFNKLSGQTDTTLAVCPGYKTQCDSPLSVLRGYRKWIYSGVVTMPARCSAWRISSVIDTRNNSTNLGGFGPFYLETMMNNTGSFQGNSSPYFASVPVPDACINQPTGFSHAAIDPDGDSLAFVAIMPRTVTTNGNCTATPTNMTYQSGFPSYAPSYNPFQTSNSFNMSALTGIMTFTPTLLGAGTVATRIMEYRNGVLIGYVEREIQVQVNQCNATMPTTQISVPTPIDVCAGTPLNFCWYVKSASTSTLLVSVDDHAITLPGSTVSYQGQGTDSVAGCLSWTPGVQHKGLHRLVILTKDITCTAPGTYQTYYATVDVWVSAPAFAGNDTAICAGNSLQLNVSGQGIPSWSVIYGTPNSLSCTTCQFPVLTPAVKTAYELILTSGTPCLNSKDTIVVNIGPYNKPSVSITAAPDTIVPSNTPVTFTATPVNCNNPTYQWQKNGVDIAGATAATYTSANPSDLDVFIVKMKCTDTCITDTPSNKLTIHEFVNVKDIGTDNLTIHPNPSAGEFMIAGYTTADKLSIEIVNVTGQVIYKQDRVSTANGRIEHKVNIGNVSNGSYMLRIKTPGKVFTERLTIQR